MKENMSAEFAELVHQGVYFPNPFDFADGVYTREFAKKIPTLLRVVVQARPLEIPPALLALPPDAEVILRYKHGDSVKEAWFARSILESKIQRQANGFFELSEAAEILSESCTGASGGLIPPERFSKDMHNAFFSGRLPCFNESLTLMDFQNEDETFNFGMYGEITTPKAINAWLESTGSPHRFPELTTHPAPPVAAIGASGGAEPWKLKAQECAREIIKRDKAKDLYPSQLNIAHEIATGFRKDGVIGVGGKPLTGEYIKRHALKGISSEQDKKLSTAIGWGK